MPAPPPSNNSPPIANEQNSPNFKIGLLRTSHLPPTLAQFIVPLNFTKLDMKDYLYKAYDIRTRSVRSYVVQQKVRRIKNLDEMRREPYRPRAIKKMTVEMNTPFVYPDPPEDLSPYVLSWRYWVGWGAYANYKQMGQCHLESG